MKRQSRVGDKSLVPEDTHHKADCPHTAAGPATQGSPNVKVNGKPALRVKDTGIHGPGYQTPDPQLNERLNQYADPGQINDIVNQASDIFKNAQPLDKLAKIRAFFANHPRYFYDPKFGWMDMMHIAASKASTEQATSAGASVLGWGVEAVEWLTGELGSQRNKESAFQPEDDRSNALGRKLGRVKGLIIDIKGILNQKQAAARCGVSAKCCGPNTWVATTGSNAVLINNQPAHRLDDQDQHCGGPGYMVEGSDDVYVGDGGQSPMNQANAYGLALVPVQREVDPGGGQLA